MKRRAECSQKRGLFVDGVELSVIFLQGQIGVESMPLHSEF